MKKTARQLQNEIEILELRELGQWASNPPSAVLEVTRELFPGESKLEIDFNPDEPTDRFVVVNVKATGAIDAVLQRQELWHKRIRALEPRHFAQLRLYISEIQ